MSPIELASTLKVRMPPKHANETAYGCPRDFLGHRFVYVAVSPRARGLSIGINMNPDGHCNFDCAYCEVSRGLTPCESWVDVDVMASELRQTLEWVRTGEIRWHSHFSKTPAELLQLRHVALSGDGEPTICPNFAEIVQALVHVRAQGDEFFKLVLISNSTGLHLPAVQEGLKFFTGRDEIWAKLDAGTQEYMNKVNGPQVTLLESMSGILSVAQKRPVVIQSLFPSINGVEPSAEEIAAYTQRLCELVRAGARISMVQIYSATRPTPHSECGHLPLKTLSHIAQMVRANTGLRAEVF